MLGLGNVGYWAAKLMSDMGAKVVALADSSSAVYSTKGIDPEKAMRHKAGKGSLRGLSDAELLNPLELPEVPCDILVPAAVEGQIHADNANGVKAKLVVEGANGPTTPEADAILADKGITLVPDILANSGGVVVSYFEWAQNIQGFSWDLETVNSRMEAIMVRGFNEVMATAIRYKRPLRQGALTLAVQRVAETMQARGLCP